MCSNIADVIGSLTSLDCPSCNDWIPLRTRDSLTMLLPLPGSGSPLAMCNCWMADSYNFMVLWAMLLLASTGTNRHSVSSEAGSGAADRKVNSTSRLRGKSFWFLRLDLWKNIVPQLCPLIGGPVWAHSHQQVYQHYGNFCPAFISLTIQRMKQW